MDGGAAEEVASARGGSGTQRPDVPGTWGMLRSSRSTVCKGGGDVV